MAADVVVPKGKLTAPDKRFYVYRYRDSMTGKWVSQQYAGKHPDVTIRVRQVKKKLQTKD